MGPARTITRGRWCCGGVCGSDCFAVILSAIVAVIVAAGDEADDDIEDCNSIVVVAGRFLDAIPNADLWDDAE